MEIKQKNDDKNIVKNIKFLDKDQLMNIFEKVKNYSLIVYKFLKSNQNGEKMVWFLSAVAFIFLIYSWLSLYNTIQNSNKNIYELEKINKYDTQLLKSNPVTQDSINSMNVIWDMIKDNDETKSEIKRYLEYKDNLQLSYNNFLQYLLLPKLNIRKKLYTNEFDLDILWKDYLNNNPYNDINLLQKWTNFLANTDNNQINNIKEMNIYDIRELDNWLFAMDISFDFMTPSRAWLLFLTDKLTTTSDKNNIGLLWEFFYYLRQQIKLEKKVEIEQLQKALVFSWSDSITEENIIDKIIGYNIYQRVFEDNKNEKDSKNNIVLIDDKLINNTINIMLECKPNSQDECFYRFRDKYRNIWSLAYTIWIQNSTSKTSDLKNFIQNIPPLMAIKEFSFDKIQSQWIIQDKDTRYQWQVKMEVYWKNISEEEIKEIANNLGQKCFTEAKELTVQTALDIVDNTIKNKWNLLDQAKLKTSNIQNLKNVIEKINLEYPNLGNYKKTIRLFEVYRMLNENWLCESI